MSKEKWLVSETIWEGELGRLSLELLKEVMKKVEEAEASGLKVTFDVYGGYEECGEIAWPNGRFYYTREETDDELEKRIEREQALKREQRESRKKLKEAREALQLKQYERLKKKFEGQGAD